MRSTRSQRAVSRDLQLVARYRLWGALWYEGYRLLEVSRAATFWLLTFGSHYDICDQEGETEEQFDPLPEFLGANVKIDWIDPHDPGVPTSQEYDPRRGPPPWPTGPEGRIEMEFTVEYPPPLHRGQYSPRSHSEANRNDNARRRLWVKPRRVG